MENTYTYTSSVYAKYRHTHLLDGYTAEDQHIILSEVDKLYEEHKTRHPRKNVNIGSLVNEAISRVIKDI